MILFFYRSLTQLSAPWQYFIQKKTFIPAILTSIRFLCLDFYDITDKALPLSNIMIRLSSTTCIASSILSSRMPSGEVSSRWTVRRESLLNMNSSGARGLYPLFFTGGVFEEVTYTQYETDGNLDFR